MVNQDIWSNREIIHITTTHENLKTTWTILQFYQIFADRILSWKIRKLSRSKQVKVGILDGLERNE